MNKGTISDIKPGMLVKLEVSDGPDLGIVYRADTAVFNVLMLDNSGEIIPAALVGADEIICAWNLAKLPTYVISDLLQGRASGRTTALDNALVYQSIRPEAVEMTLEEISELASKQLGKPVTVTVKESESCEADRDKTEGKVDDCAESGMIEVAVGECIERDGITYRCVEDKRQRSPYCDGCELSDKFCADFECSAACREDGISVHFVKEDVAEPETEVFVVSDDGAIARDARIGEEFEIKGVRYRVIDGTRALNNNCDGCALKADRRCCYYTGRCDSGRKDGKSILFERVPTEEVEEDQ